MGQVSKRILVVSLDDALRNTRASMLQRQGYEVISTPTDDEAMKLLNDSAFDLVLLGRDAQELEKQLDQRVREKYPEMLILKIQMERDEMSVYPSRTTHPVPQNVVNVLKEMFAVGTVRLAGK